MQKTPTVGIYKTNQQAIMPVYSTEQAACFDISACIQNQEVAYYIDYSRDKKIKPILGDDGSKFINVLSNERVLVPTGIIFDIPVWYSIRLHPRSGLSLKNGLVLGNQEGVIDSDYIHETFVIMHNITNIAQQIKHGDRICQAEIVPVYHTAFEEISEAPKDKTNRIGGFGSTGVSA